MNTFSKLVDAIQARDGCSGTEALVKARKEHPVEFAASQAAPITKSNIQTVREQVAFGKSLDKEIAAAVQELMAADDSLDRTTAMAQLRRTKPELWETEAAE